MAKCCVNSIADLRALSAGAFSCLTLLGYHVPGDGGGGGFYWDDSASEPDNAGTIIAPASDPPVGRWKRIYSGALNVRWFGAKGDGIANDRTPVQNAINAGAATNGGLIDVVFPLGKYLMSGCSLETPSTATQLVLRGAEEVTLGRMPGSHIWCNGVKGALLGFNSTLAAISIVGLDIDGSNGGGSSYDSLSTMWTGLFPTPASGAPNIRVSGCAIHSTSVKGAKAIDLTNLVFGLVENCNIWQFVNGYAVYLAGEKRGLATTATLRKLYLHLSLECLYVGSQVSDCHVYDTVFESSLVALSAYDSQVSLNGCYFENIGFIPFTEGQKTPLTLQNFGIDDVVAPPDNVPVNTAIHLRYGSVVFRSCIFQYLGPLAVAWVRGVGMRSIRGEYGSVTFDACRRAIGLKDVFIAPPEENSGGYAFRVFDPSAVDFGVNQGIVVYTSPIGVVQSYADARLVTYGRIILLFESPDVVRPVKVENGLFVYGQEPDNAYTGPLAAAPTGGSNLVGDRVINSAPAAGASMGWVCVAAGCPGTWKAYAPIAT